jgi:hypothetical protein
LLDEAYTNRPPSQLASGRVLTVEKPLLILMLAIIGVVVWRLHSSPRQRVYGPKMAAQDRPNPYRCVSIHSRKDACEPAKQLAGKRFLPREAPSLPLANCTATSCRCRYMHHEDRRLSGEDQRAPFKGEYSKGLERRSGRDRRSYSPA